MELDEFEELFLKLSAATEFKSGLFWMKEFLDLNTKAIPKINTIDAAILHCCKFLLLMKPI